MSGMKILWLLQYRYLHYLYLVWFGTTGYNFLPNKIKHVRVPEEESIYNWVLHDHDLSRNRTSNIFNIKKHPTPSPTTPTCPDIEDSPVAKCNNRNAAEMVLPATNPWCLGGFNKGCKRCRGWCLGRSLPEKKQLILNRPEAHFAYTNIIHSKLLLHQSVILKNF